MMSKYDYIPTDLDENPSTWVHIWRIARPILVVVISFIIVISVAVKGYNWVMDEFIRPVDVNDTTPVEITIANGMGTSAIANLLYGETEEERLITSKLTFKIYIDFLGKSSQLRAGMYIFNKSMPMSEIVSKLVAGEEAGQEVVQFRLTEGMTIEDMAESLVTQGALENTDEFLKLCRTGEGFERYEPVEAGTSSQRKYELEGYLFPDTYKIYKGKSAAFIINLMLTQFNQILTVDDIERAEELNMSIDDIVILASIIEKEAKTSDFTKVSAVLHNRLNEDMLLQSDVTIKYALGVTELYLSSEQLETETPYNTHINKGLPVGPVCNPGLAAIQAALYPEEQYLTDNYLYFTLKEPESGELAFAQTYQEHLQNVEKYRELWIEYDAAQQAAANALAETTPGPSAATE